MLYDIMEENCLKVYQECGLSAIFILRQPAAVSETSNESLRLPDRFLHMND